MAAPLPPPEIDRVLNNAADKTGLPRNFIRAVAFVESRYNPEATSRVGAIGLMQLMPRTAEGLGVDPHDPEQNALGGAQFLKRLILKYSGDVHKALAAYNWGPGNVETTSMGDWPASVHAYVSKILDLAEETTVLEVWRRFLYNVIAPYPKVTL